MLLTYAQCPIPKDEVKLQLAQKLGDPKEYIVAQELHKDEHLHIHVYWYASKKLNIRDQHFLDLVWEGVTYHGKVYDPKLKRMLYSCVPPVRKL